MVNSSSDSSAASQRRQLGAAMRGFRKEAGIDRDEAAALIEVSGVTLTRKEAGQFRFKRSEIEMLAKAYNVPEEQVAMLVELGRQTRTQSKHGEFPMFVPVKVRAFVELERDAAEIVAVTFGVIPALLQTEAYMRELWRRSGELLSTTRIAELIKLRQDRQKIITRSNDAPKLRVVMHEFALRLPVGGPAVMREQLLHLAKMCERPNIDVQIQPISAGAYPSMDEGFNLLRFGTGPNDDVVQVLNVEAFYRDKAVTEQYRDVWDRRKVAALDLRESQDLILEVADTYASEASR